MSMRMEIQQSMQQRMQQTQRLQLKMYLGHDFQEYINIEDDEDLDLLHESLPFMALHELAHPLFEDGEIFIPAIKPSQKLAGRITSLGRQMGFETGIDKAAIEIGQKACGYSRREMYTSHVALLERVHRDVFETERFPFEEGFIARLQAELRVHASHGSGDLVQRIDLMAKSFDHGVRKRLLGKNYGIYQALVNAYAKVYRGTKLVKNRPHGGSRGAYFPGDLLN